MAGFQLQQGRLSGDRELACRSEQTKSTHGGELSSLFRCIPYISAVGKRLHVATMTLKWSITPLETHLSSGDQSKWDFFSASHRWKLSFIPSLKRRDAISFEHNHCPIIIFKKINSHSCPMARLYCTAHWCYHNQLSQKPTATIGYKKPWIQQLASGW